MEYKNILVLVEKDSKSGLLSDLSKELLAKARELADELKEEVLSLTIGYNIESIAEETGYYGADKAICVDEESLEDYSTIPYTKVLDEMVDKYMPRLMFISSNPDGRDLGARLCARRQIGLVADCLDVVPTEDKEDFKWIRPTFDGKFLSDIRISSFPKIGTIASGVFRLPEKDESRKAEIIKEIVEIPKDNMITIIEKCIKSKKKEKPLSSHSNRDIIVSGGMGIGEQENWHLIEDLAKAVNGLVGATKPVCDLGWVSADKQIGSTGVKVAPKIYIAIGISGAIQHIAGMRNSEVIIAINNDPNAQIFKYANYSIVGDLFEVVPLLTERLKELMN